MNDMDLDFAASAKPFASVVLCCTGVDHEERTVLVNHAQQMGAAFKADLRSDVTHLIVGNVNTPKYEYAAHSRFDLKIMDLKWVEKAYEKWIQGEDVNLDDTMSAHILPPLYGLHICLTNIASQEDRKLLESRIKSHGGTYHPDLSRQCTHLLCASASGKKYEAALKWGLNCVGVEWLFQSIERGMALDPKYYGLDIDPQKRGEGAWDRNAMLKASGLSEVAVDKIVPMEFEGGGGRKRRLRRAGSKMAQEVWDGILGGVTEQAPDTLHVQTAEDVSMQSLHIADDMPGDVLGMDFDQSKGLFDGMIFYTWGFNDKQRKALTNVITKNAGLVFTKPLPGAVIDISGSFTVIPYKCPREEAPTGYAGSEVVTQMWIERCLVANTAFDPSDVIMCKPMPGPFPRPYLRNIAICITGFSGPDLLHVEQLIVLMGGNYYANLTRKRSLLLTTDNQLGGPKLTKAKEWGIPVVNIGWFWNVITRPEEADLTPWCDHPVELVRYIPEEASSGMKSATATDESVAQAATTKEPSMVVLNGIEKSATTTPEQKREKRPRQDENIPPNQSTEVKMEQITKLLNTVSSPQKKSKRKLAGRARNTQTTHSSVASPEETFTNDDIPRATQDKVEYKDPVAEREMAKIVANLQGITEEEKVAQAQAQKGEMTPAEDIGRRGGRRKSARK